MSCLHGQIKCKPRHSAEIISSAEEVIAVLNRIQKGVNDCFLRYS